MGGVGRDVCQDGTFFIPGLHENVSTRDDFTGKYVQAIHRIAQARGVNDQKLKNFQWLSYFVIITFDKMKYLPIDASCWPCRFRVHFFGESFFFNGSSRDL